MALEDEKGSTGRMLDLSRLSGDEITRFATHMAAANLNTLLDRRREIADLTTDELRKMIDLGRATRAHCGGLDCG
ncbi:MAG: hypothetical protein ACRD26_12820 [Vicinamibacterales bacterium]